jgi:hypothetical protein
MPEAKQADKETIAAKVKDAGADAVLMTRLTDKKTVRDYVPGTAYMPPPSYLDWYGYYGGFFTPYPPGYPPGYPGSAAVYPPGYMPGYVEETVYDIAEANLYDAETGKLIWSAVTESPVQGNDNKAIKSYVAKVLDAMRKQRLMP